MIIYSNATELEYLINTLSVINMIPKHLLYIIIFSLHLLNNPKYFTTPSIAVQFGVVHIIRKVRGGGLVHNFILNIKFVTGRR
jgi:hypothetical protein